MISVISVLSKKDPNSKFQVSNYKGYTLSILGLGTWGLRLGPCSIYVKFYVPKKANRKERGEKIREERKVFLATFAKPFATLAVKAFYLLLTT
jgi:hypothetical protein